MALILRYSSKYGCRRNIFGQMHRRKSTRSREHKLLSLERSTDNSYDAIVKSHQEIAEKSILVGYGGNISQLYATCAKHGPLQAIYPYISGPKKYALVQMGSRSAIDSIIANSRQFENPDKIPMKTRFVYQPEKSEGSSRQNSKRYPGGIVKSAQTETDIRTLHTSLLKSKSADDQMRRLCEFMSVSEFAVRIRFFLCSALGEALRGTLPGCSIVPFGSTVNGFGRNGGDLDMLLETDVYQEPQNYLEKDGFVFFTKKKQENSRFQVQMTLETLGGIISNFIPQFGFVRKILKARVPIVRFTSMSTNMECDLSINNRSALYMSELLHLYSRLDDRVRPLVFTIRHWAKMTEVTQSKPGLYLTNFMLTWMVIFFIQTKTQPILPLIAELRKYASPGDKKLLNGKDITFVRDWSKVPPSHNQQNLGELLLEFFHFYSTFDFEQNALSMHRGIFSKPSYIESESDFLYIENPIEQEFNAAKIVSDSEVRKFQEACGATARKLRNSLDMKPGRTPWGVMSILFDNDINGQRLNVSVGNIFGENGPSAYKTEELNGQWADVSSPISGSFLERNETPGNDENLIPVHDIENKD